MSEKDGLEQFQDDAGRSVRRVWLFLLVHVREWGVGKLLVCIAALLAGAAASTFLLPVLVAVLSVVAAIAIVIYGVYSHRQVHRERALRRFAEIQALRARQERLRYEAVIHQATLGLVGDRSEGVGRLGFRGFSELAAAIRYARRGSGHRQSQVVAGSGQPARRSEVVDKSPSVAGARRRLEAIEVEKNVLEAQIQQLAYPSEGTERDVAVAREEWRRVRAADREARRRGLQGKTPSPEKPALSLSVALSPDGSREVSRGVAKPTPEQIARGDLDADAA